MCVACLGSNAKMSLRPMTVSFLHEENAKTICGFNDAALGRIFKVLLRSIKVPEAKVFRTQVITGARVTSDSSPMPPGLRLFLVTAVVEEKAILTHTIKISAAG